jgi:hypothetical protein
MAVIGILRCRVRRKRLALGGAAFNAHARESRWEREALPESRRTVRPALRSRAGDSPSELSNHEKKHRYRE